MRPPNGLGPDNDFAPVLRPHITPYATFTVSADTYEADLEPIADAATAATSLPLKDRLLEIIYEPGTYPALWGGFTYAHSSTLNAEDVIIETDVTGGGTHHQYEAPLAVFEGITLSALAHPSEEGPKYPLHITTGNSTISLIRCILRTRNDAHPSVLGLDGGDGLSLNLYECQLDNDGLGPLFNIHGAEDNTQGLEINLIHCTAVGDTPVTVDYDSLIAAPLDQIAIRGGNLEYGTLTNAGGGSFGTWPCPVGGLARQNRYALLNY